MKLTKESLLSTLPVVLAEDPDMYALASVIAGSIADRIGEIDLARIYPRIDELPEELCDILAYDFKVDWWEYDAPLSEKRETLKRAWYVHRHKGTKSAVERAVGAKFPGTYVEEWFEYDGDPYYFRLTIPLHRRKTNNNENKQIRRLIDYFKNLRSVLESIIFVTDMEQTVIRPCSRLGRGYVRTALPELLRDKGFDYSLFVVTPMMGITETTLPDITPPNIGPLYTYLVDEMRVQLTDEQGNWLVDE